MLVRMLHWLEQNQSVWLQFNSPFNLLQLLLFSQRENLCSSFYDMLLHYMMKSSHSEGMLVGQLVL